MVQLKVNTWHTKKHKEFATGVSWSGSNDLLSVADDRTIWQWNVDGEPQAQLMEVESCCTDLQRVPVLEPSSHFIFLALQSQVLVPPFVVLGVAGIGTSVRRLHEPLKVYRRGRGGCRDAT